jgi:hypothetical protein
MKVSLSAILVLVLVLVMQYNTVLGEVFTALSDMEGLVSTDKTEATERVLL